MKCGLRELYKCIQLKVEYGTLVGFEVFTVVVLKSIFFWDMMPSSRRHIPEEDTLQWYSC
jgi:hypothetical protein